MKMEGFGDSLYTAAVHSEFSAQESQKQVLGLAYKSFVCYALILNYAESANAGCRLPIRPARLLGIYSIHHCSE